VLIHRLWLTDFRGYTTAEAAFDPGLTAVLGANGQGKSNLIEAIAYLATLRSFRGAPTDALVRAGADAAVVRAEAERDGRRLQLEAELSRRGRNRAQLNRQPLRRAADLLGALQVSVFSPDDLALIKSGPSDRRDYLDGTLVALQARNDRLRTDLERVLRQRAALLRQTGGRLSTEVELTLEVFDAKLVGVGEQLATAREDLVGELAPVVADAYEQVARSPAEVLLRYDAPWRVDGLAAALQASRTDDLRRGVTTVGPHRDDLDVLLHGLPARTHASQGEQRSLALALRLAAHRLVTSRLGTPPVLLLDDVFSELDPSRSDALLHTLPAGQTILTTASGLPPGAVPGRVLLIESGSVTER